ncbi:MAG TPA: hypothetical protein VFA50_00690 [Stellaceae bacterium]|nr:hypothetical protein [Stellaceae bacterium]
MARGALFFRRTPAPAAHATLTLMKNYLVLVLVLIAAALLGEFVFAFADWNKTQACATAGGRNCAPRVMLSR